MTTSFVVMADGEESKSPSRVNRRLVYGLGFLVIALPVVVGVLVWHFRPKCETVTPAVTSNQTDQSPLTTTRPDTGIETGPWSKLRLSRDVIPIHYDLTLFPDFYGDHGWFYGNETIQLEVRGRTRFVLIHIKHLNITRTELSNNETGETIPIKQTFEREANEFYVIETESDLEPGTKVNVQLQFDGSLTRTIVGFYKSSYVDSITGATRNMASSKFEPIAARRAFPCLDEPNMKAEFTVTIVHKPGYMALSNMPVETLSDWEEDSALKATQFKRSVTMSTYLVCFVVCQFVYLEETSRSGNKIRVYAPEDKLNETKYALSVAITTIDLYTSLFNISYPLPKLDLIGIPDYPSGATEHWGLITFRESRLLFDPAEASAANKQRVAEVVAHEVSHQWFGNLVTMDWWDDLWLNEGFASFVQYLGTSAREPDWKMLEQFAVNYLQPVMVTDTSAASRPIIMEITSSAQMNEVFDAISYYKGSSVIRMVQAMSGKEAFFRGVSEYLTNFEFKNAKTADLWRHLGEIQPGIQAKDVMDTWTMQMGLPYIDISVDDNGHVITAKQHRFLADSSATFNASESPFNYVWYIQLDFQTSSGEKGIAWMKETKAETFNVTTSLDDPNAWIKFNIDQTGYYRVNYPEGLWRRFSTTLVSQGPSAFSSTDRANLIDDAFNLARAGILDYDVALHMTLYLNNERERQPWDGAYRGFGYLSSMFKFTRSYSVLRKYVIERASPMLQSLGWGDTGTHLQKLLRPQIVHLTCGYGEESCINEAYSRLSGWLYRNNSIPPNLRDSVYVYGMVKSSNPDDWDVMWQRYLAETNSQERTKLMKALSNTRTVWLLSRYIEFAKNESYVRSQDYLSVLTYISGNPVGRGLVWDFIRQNWDYLVGRYSLYSRALGRLIPDVVSDFNTQHQLQEVEDFFARYPDAGAGALGRKRAIDTIGTNIAWMEKNRDTIDMWMLKHTSVSR